MIEHDPLCPWQVGYPCTHCDLIAKVREDEREKVVHDAASVEAVARRAAEVIHADLHTRVAALRQDEVGMVSRRQVLDLIDGADA